MTRSGVLDVLLDRGLATSAFDFRCWPWAVPASAAALPPTAGPGQQARASHNQHWQPAPQPLQQTAGYLLGALLLAHQRIHHQRRPGQPRDHPLQHRQLPLRLGEVGWGPSAGVVPPCTGAAPARISRSPSARE
jgi:hypothetical protein